MKFSVLLSIYEKEHPEFLTLALDSILNQTLLPSQIVLVQDGPLPPYLSNVIESYRLLNPTLFSIVALEKNVGLGKALKFGLDACKFDLVARMDTDDICYPVRFQEQVNFMLSNSHISVLGSSIQEFKKKPYDLNRFKAPPETFEELKKFAKFRNPLNHPSVIFRKSHAINAGSYQHMPLFEDYFLWVRMLQLGYKIENLNLPLLHFRIGNDMIGRRHGLAYLKKEFNFLKAIRKSGFINSFELASSYLFKLPLRLLPKSLLSLLYKKVLR